MERQQELVITLWYLSETIVARKIIGFLDLFRFCHFNCMYYYQCIITIDNIVIKRDWKLRGRDYKMHVISYSKNFDLKNLPGHCPDRPGSAGAYARIALEFMRS